MLGKNNEIDIMPNPDKVVGTKNSTGTGISKDMSWILRNLDHYGNSLVPANMIRRLGLGVVQGMLQDMTGEDVWIRKTATVSCYGEGGRVDNSPAYIAETPEVRRKRKWRGVLGQ